MWLTSQQGAHVGLPEPEAPAWKPGDNLRWGPSPASGRIRWGVGGNALAAPVPTASPQPHTLSRPPRLHSCLPSSTIHAAGLTTRMDRTLQGPLLARTDTPATGRPWDLRGPGGQLARGHAASPGQLGGAQRGWASGATCGCRETLPRSAGLRAGHQHLQGGAGPCPPLVDSAVSSPGSGAGDPDKAFLGVGCEGPLLLDGVPEQCGCWRSVQAWGCLWSRQFTLVYSSSLGDQTRQMLPAERALDPFQKHTGGFRLEAQALSWWERTSWHAPVDNGTEAPSKQSWGHHGARQPHSCTHARAPERGRQGRGGVHSTP